MSIFYKCLMAKIIKAVIRYYVKKQNLLLNTLLHFGRFCRIFIRGQLVYTGTLGLKLIIIKEYKLMVAIFKKKKKRKHY